MKYFREIIIGVLVFVVIGLVVYNNKISRENNVYRQTFNEEKETLQKELDSTLQDLAINEVENIEISSNLSEANKKIIGIRNQLKKSRQDIQELKEELNKPNEYGFEELQNLRKSFQEVKINNQLLYVSLDSIKTLNDSLILTIAVAKSELNAEKQQTKELSLKLSEAVKIQIAKVEVLAIQQKESGEIKETKKRKNVNGIQVKYNVLNNKALKGLERDVFYILKNDKNEIISANGEFHCNKKLKEYTDATRVLLNGETMQISDIIPLKDIVLEKGSYTVDFYSLDGILATETFVLKNNFLGVF